jgi:hypothetical protein
MGMHVDFEHVFPDQIQVGDVIMCYKHDDQHEQANAKVVGIERDNTPGVFLVGGHEYHYDYRLWLVCRHFSLRYPDAEGGPEYRWHLFPWNGVSRYKASSVENLIHMGRGENGTGGIGVPVA